MDSITLTRLRQPTLSQRVRLVTAVIGFAVLAGVAANALQWPVWHIYAPLAVVNTLLAVAYAAIAPLFYESGVDPRRQPTPWVFGAAALCRSGAWVATWHPHQQLFSLVSRLMDATFWLLAIVVVLLWSRRPFNRWERRYVGFAAVTLYGGALLVVASHSSPVARLVAAGLDLVLIGFFLVLVARRTRQSLGLERRALLTSQLPALVAIPTTVITALAAAGSSGGRYLLFTVLGLALLAMPVTVVIAMARLAGERAEVADAVKGLAWPANPHRLRSALRRALHDPAIELGYWVPDLERYVDADGHSMADPTPDRFTVLCQDERQVVEAVEGLGAPSTRRSPEVRAPLAIPDNPYAASAPLRLRGPATALAPPMARPEVAVEPATGPVEARAAAIGPPPSHPVALLVGGPQHFLRPDLVKAALQAAGPALALATLQAGLQAERRDLAAAHREVEESRWAERRRLEQNLHDGAQHRLAALTMRLGAASATVPLDGRAKDLVGEIQDEIREVLRELREVADGIHPTALTEAGLGPALEAVAERFPVSVTITAPARRFPPVVEAVAYYSTTEVLTIVTRQLSAAEVRVEVWTRGGDLWVRMTGVGVDTRSQTPDRYLAPLGSGIRAIGGELLLPTTEGSIFTVAARIPCE